MKTSDFIENLQWALDLEEDMAERLVHMCHPQALPQSIAEDSRKRIEALLGTIREDTQRHAKIVSDIVLEMSTEQDVLETSGEHEVLEMSGEQGNG